MYDKKAPVFLEKLLIVSCIHNVLIEAERSFEYLVCKKGPLEVSLYICSVLNVNKKNRTYPSPAKPDAQQSQRDQKFVISS